MSTEFSMVPCVQFVSMHVVELRISDTAHMLFKSGLERPLICPLKLA